MDSDERLLSRYLEGDEHAFEQLVTRHEASLRKLAYGFVRDAALAEDIVQDVFIRAYRKGSSFKPGGTVKAWLYRIAINRARDELRRLRRRKEVPLEEGPPGGLTTVEGLVASREAARHISAALARMKAEHRTPVILREIAGMTYQEIAETLGWPLGTVQARIHRGRLELRSLLGKIRRSKEPRR